MKNENETTMNLYIINEVLFDYTAGMAVIAAESLDQCREFFFEEFGLSAVEEYDAHAKIKVIEGVNHSAGIVSFVYGGA